MGPITVRRARAVRRHALTLCRRRAEFSSWVTKLRYGTHCVDRAFGVVHGTIEGTPTSIHIATVGASAVTVARYHFFNKTLDIQMLGPFGSVFCAFTVPLPET